MSFNAIRENKILAKNSEFTVCYIVIIFIFSEEDDTLSAILRTLVLCWEKEFA